MVGVQDDKSSDPGNDQGEPGWPDHASPSRLPVLVFVVLWAVAMAVYPGWNAFDNYATGHDFLRNFLCDLLSATTPDGRSNAAGSLAMNSGMALLVTACFLPLWWRVPGGSLARSSSRLLGVLAALLTLAICAEQAFALRWSHNALTLAAAAAGLIPTAMAGIADWRAPDNTLARRALLCGMMVASLANFIGYALVQFGCPLTTFVPAAQKAALVFLLMWLLLVPKKHLPHG